MAIDVHRKEVVLHSRAIGMVMLMARAIWSHHSDHAITAILSL